MLRVISTEYSTIDFDILSGLGRWIKGFGKVFDLPLRIELEDVVTEMPDGPVALVHAFYTPDGQKRSTYTYWNGGSIDTSGTFFFERDVNGKISRIIPPEEEAVPVEWNAALVEFESKRQSALPAAGKRFG